MSAVKSAHPDRFDSTCSLALEKCVPSLLKSTRSRRKPTGNPRGRPAGSFALGVRDLRTYLLRIGDHYNETHLRPHNRTIAKALKKSTRQVCRYLRALENEKLLRRQKRKFYHTKHYRFLTARVLIPLKYPGQAVFGEPWWPDPAPNLKLDDDVKRVIENQPLDKACGDARMRDPNFLAKKNRLLLMLRRAQSAAGGDSRGPEANQTIRNINRALQELSQ